MKPILNTLKALLYPPRCVICRRLLEDEAERLCPDCAGLAGEPISGARRGQHYSRWVSVFPYEDQVRSSILRYKFSGCRFYARTYGPLLARAIQKGLGTDWDLMTYVPLSPKRRRRRGYDQALLLARETGRVLGTPPVCTLKKQNRIKPQSSMGSAAAREANIRGAFSPTDPGLAAGKRVLLIDDILTTGATVSEASRVLKAAGAKEVYVATLAVRIL